MTDNITWFHGIQIVPGSFTVENLSFVQNFLVKDDDVFLVTYPRSGTHWMCEILSLIITKGDPTWVQTVHIRERILWMEYRKPQKVLMHQDRPHFMATHLPIHLFPKSYFTSRAKIIHVIRNPRDVAVSHYHLKKYVHHLNDEKPFDEYLHGFLHGDMLYGSWFDHTLGWLTRRDTENFLLMSYEDLQRDLRGNVQKLCEFLGKHLSPEQLDSVVQNSSFSVMKDNRMSSSAMIENPGDEPDSIVPLLRKGICGDWKNHFTVAQSEAFDKVYQEKLSSLDPGLFPWSEDC